MDNMLPLDPLILVGSFLTGTDLSSFSRCNKHLHRSFTSTQADHLFHALCLRELGVDEKKLFMKPFDVDCEFWLEVYRDWRTELRDYNLDDVKRMKIFWDDFKHELRRQGASEVVDSLGHRCSVAEIKDIEDSIFDNSNIGDVEKVDEYENSHRKCMPSVLSLMYRFVNGQKYRSRTVPKHGMFGGYSKYGEVSNVMFLSLEDLPSISDAFRAICQNYAATSDDLFNSITSINRDAYRDYHMHDNFLPFAFCASGGKVFVLGRSNSVCVLTAEHVSRQLDHGTGTTGALPP